MKTSRIALVAATLAFTGTLVLFQNCTAGPIGDAASVGDLGKPANNGDGYTGKVYVDVDKAGSCGAAGGVKAAIEQSGDRYYQTVNNCQPQTPVDVTGTLDVMAYNAGALFRGAVLFERLAVGQSSYSEVVCRGEAQHNQPGQKAFADVSMQPTGDFFTDPGGVKHAVYVGYAKVGIYDLAGNLRTARSFAITRAIENVAPGARMFGIDAPAGSPPGEAYALVVRDASGSFLFRPPGQSAPLIVDAMSCHYH